MGYADSAHRIALCLALGFATFIVGGILISRPGVRIGWGSAAGIEPKSLELCNTPAGP
jgi:hypothetical protein